MRGSALGALALACVLAFAATAKADECEAQRLVSAFGPQTYAQGTHAASFAAPTTAGRWFVTVERSGPAVTGTVRLNGQALFGPADFAGGRR
ncbi:MAG: hypothetical protein L0206_09215, partial [Actinobacteria bacterium]|nr:hypothetical protein [Actinomycetota bacterium]